ncbi:uncharacterized protein F4812DRAFT_439306 [Daldinia caldariorum]|uniref:uncharacterized protein n=1 Tax=Daldinia caldariorum TaxID=326644 RepID=UPI0020073C74|nr:uncharacterized protein F4812DRAFT_439306 [Daldinia caldariorum]KAI1465031.1 hypothetical protein F4812DRAFT_439306 [Daldinia caldariorum]
MASSQSYHRLYSTGKEDDSEHEELNSGPSIYHQNHQKVQIMIIALLVVSNVTFAGLWLASWMHRAHLKSSDCVRPQLTYSPATSAIRYEKKRLWRDIDGPNPFTGKPRPEFDQAWRDIIAPITIKVSDSELARFSEGDSTIAFKDGSGYIAEMAVYHELHCIKRVRRHLNLNLYYPNLTEVDRQKEDAHIDHCLEYWRESAMCRGDTTLGTFFWRDGVPTSRVYTDNECVDWYALDHWARQRMVNMTDYSQFKRDG